jgi:hypothetical protein
VSPDAVFIPACHPLHVQAGRLSELKQYGFFGKELAGDPLLLVKNGSVACDSAVSSPSFPEPFLRIRSIACTAVCGHRGGQK